MASSLGIIVNSNLNNMAPFHVTCTNRVVHSELPAGWAIRDSKICRGKSFFSSRSMFVPALGCNQHCV